MGHLHADDVTIVVRENYWKKDDPEIRLGVVGRLNFKGLCDHSDIGNLLEFLNENFYEHDHVRFEVKINSRNS
jgi:hypothetical protein